MRRVFVSLTGQYIAIAPHVTIVVSHVVCRQVKMIFVIDKLSYSSGSVKEMSGGSCASPCRGLSVHFTRCTMQ